jgi:hypothetical protein
MRNMDSPPHSHRSRSRWKVNTSNPFAQRAPDWKPSKQEHLLVILHIILSLMTVNYSCMVSPPDPAQHVQPATCGTQSDSPCIYSHVSILKNNVQAHGMCSYPTVQHSPPHITHSLWCDSLGSGIQVFSLNSPNS